MKKTTMFYGATPEIFEHAKALRNTLTETEGMLWECLSGNKLGVRFRRQHPLSRYIADFYCHEKNLVIELDGSIHNLPEHIAADKERDMEMQQLGLKVLRFTNKQVYSNLQGVVSTIKRTIENDNSPLFNNDNTIPPLGG
jgi:cyclase